jgi:hypothetical protein
MSPLSYRMLVVVTIFNAVTAVAGGGTLLATGGLGMPESMLVNGPFDSFLWPGIILLVVVGGTQVIAATLLLLRREAALLWTAIAGFAMIIWIFVETGIIAAISWLQVVYFATGIWQLILVLILLGVISWPSREPEVCIGPPARTVGRQ